MNTFATLGGVNLHYRLEHSDQNLLPVVFINSLGSDLRIWDNVSAKLERPILRYDKRGHGLSDAPAGSYVIADFAADLFGLLEYLKLERVGLVGVSVGGQIALEFASRFPERVAGAVFCDTGMKIGTAESWNARIAAVQETGLASISQVVMQRWFSAEFHANQTEQIRGFREMFESTSALGYIATCEALRESNLTLAAQTVRQSQVKTLVVCGSEDQSTPVALNQELAQTLGTKLELIEGAGHLPCVDHPEELSKILEQFLKGVA
jgi:3-oxoadipate enol-lactonase